VHRQETIDTTVPLPDEVLYDGHIEVKLSRLKNS